jgi:hypothetical protein
MCKTIDEAVQLRVRERAIDVSVSFRRVAIEVVRAENDFEGATAANEMWKTFGPTTTGMYTDPDFGAAKARVLARGEAHVAGEHELATAARTQPLIFAMLTTGDVVRRTKVSIRIGRPEGPTALVMLPVLPVR